MTVLIRSKSLMRGLFLHHNDYEKRSYHPCIITHHSEGSFYPVKLEETSTDDSSSDEEYDNIIDRGVQPQQLLPPLVDDCTELETARRIDIAKSHGFTYDEDFGAGCSYASFLEGHCICDCDLSVADEGHGIYSAAIYID